MGRGRVAGECWKGKRVDGITGVIDSGRIHEVYIHE
jgi:hypothetical protein